jgi:L-ascorbate metabolism protein UlaG (beta-lactamase superfamily)
MKLTKYEHACFTVEKDGAVIVVDPGGLTTDLIAPENVVAIVVTHNHGDHLDHDLLASIMDKNPEAIVVAPQDTVSQIEVFETRAVTGGDSVSVGPFELAFFGEKHAFIYGQAPGTDNVGVLINELVYHPGDSFTIPDVPVDTLALPAHAPWMKEAEAIDFALAVKPRMAFPTHDGFLNDAGKGLVDSLIPQFIQSSGIEYRRISGESIEL